MRQSFKKFDMLYFCILLTFSIISASELRVAHPIRAKKSNSARPIEACTQNVCPEDITTILDSFLQNYDRRIRPSFGKGPTIVKSYMFVTGFGPASERDMEYTMDMFFRQKWRDDRLAFKTRNPNISELVLNNKMVQMLWTPDSFFRNGKKSIAHIITVPNRLLRIKPEGDILYTMRLTIKAKCPMVLIDFPMDVHTCHLVYGSYGYTEDEVKFEWYQDNVTTPVDVPRQNSRLNQFKLINYTWKTDDIFTLSGEYSILEVQFHLKREMGYYIVQTYLPCFLIVILSQISFWINKEAVPARTVSGIMTLLNLTTLSISTRQSLPKVAYPTALDWYMATCFAFCFAALLEFAAVHFLDQKIKNAGGKDPNIFDACAALQKKVLEIRRNNGNMQISLQDLFQITARFPLKRKRNCEYYLRRLAGFVLPKHWLKEIDEQPPEVSREEEALAQKLLDATEKQIDELARSQGEVNRIDLISRVAFPLTFIFFNGVYWTIYLSHQGQEISYRINV